VVVVVVVVVVVPVAYRHILVNISTTRTTSCFALASSRGAVTCSTFTTSRIAPHSMAEPRAIA
jgi:hypothetical protein